MPAYIFLDPDGSQDFGLVAIVRDGTGVVYAHQCGGLMNDLCEAEGFAVPLGGPPAARGLVDYFRKRFRGYPPRPPGDAYTAGDRQIISALVSEIPFWHTVREGTGEDEPFFLGLDLDRFEEVTEGWIPVLTAYGPAVLVFPNSN